MNNKFKDIDIYKLKLHESVDINDELFRGTILRVPGGWIYERDMPGYSTATSVFIPFDNEFQGRD